MRKNVVAICTMMLLLVLCCVTSFADEDIDDITKVDAFGLNENSIIEMINIHEYADYVATRESWRENLAFVKRYYETFDIDCRELLDWYIMEFSAAEKLNEQPRLPENEMVVNVAMLQQDAENAGFPVRSEEPYFATLGEKAAYYATLYYNNYNPAYPQFGLDCANFVSQCLHYAGKPMTGSATSGGQWGPNSWYCYTNSATDYANVSESWRAANGFANYWYTHSLAKGYYLPTAAANYGTAYQTANIGDAISLCYGSGSNIVAYHTMIVVGKSGGQLILAAHSSPTINTTLLDKVTANSYSGFYIFKVLSL